MRIYQYQLHSFPGAVDKKVLGPAYQDVAKKYAGQKDAVAQISDSIRKGGSGQVERHSDAGAACVERR